jgi:hypothetical protein
MSTQIVLISVDHNNARKVCEYLENMVYPTYNALFETLSDKLGSNEGFLIFTISQFMDEVNDQILDNLSEYFISYVKIEG